MSKNYQNANGNEYKIYAMVGDIGLLENLTKKGYTPYIVALRFSPYESSWGDGKYFKTLEEAKEYFKKSVNF